MKENSPHLYRILDGSDSYDRATFEYPSGGVVSPTGETILRNGSAFHRLRVVQGVLRAIDGRAFDEASYRPRHVGGDIAADSIVIYVDIGDASVPVGWFGVESV